VAQRAGADWQDLGVGDDSAFKTADFDRYIAERGIPEEDYPAAFARWIAEKTGGPVPRLEKVEDTNDDAYAGARVANGRAGVDPGRIGTASFSPAEFPREADTRHRGLPSRATVR